MQLRSAGFLIGIALLVLGCAGGKRNAPPPAAPPSGGDFRGAAWGMEMEDVEGTLEDVSAVISRTPDMLVCRDTLLKRFPVEAVYYFTEGKLRRGSYRVVDLDGIIDYTIFRIVLARKYGPVYSEASAPEEIEAVWLSPRTEIDLTGSGNALEEYSLFDPERSREGELAKIEINYYDRKWFDRDRERTEKTEAAVKESEALYQQLIGDWIEVYPSYRDYMEGAMMLEPGETYVYDPGYYNDF